MMNQTKTAKVLAGLLLGLFTVGTVLLTPITSAYAAEPANTQTQPAQPGSTTNTPANPPPTQPATPPAEEDHSGHKM